MLFVICIHVCNIYILFSCIWIEIILYLMAYIKQGYIAIREIAFIIIMP